MKYQIEVVTPKPQPVLFIEETVTPQALGDALARLFPTVHGYATEVGAAWDAVNAWRQEQNMELTFGGWDVYENDPTEASGPEEYRTRIYQPLA